MSHGASSLHPAFSVQEDGLCRTARGSSLTLAKKMGAHHFKFHLVPAGGRVSRDADGELPGNFLVGHKIPEEVVSRLRALLPKPNHWGTVEEFNSASKW